MSGKDKALSLEKQLDAHVKALNITLSCVQLYVLASLKSLYPISEVFVLMTTLTDLSLERSRRTHPRYAAELPRSQTIQH